MKRFKIRELGNHRTTTIDKKYDLWEALPTDGAAWQSNHPKRDSKVITGGLITEGAQV